MVPHPPRNFSSMKTCHLSSHSSLRGHTPRAGLLLWLQSTASSSGPTAHGSPDREPGDEKSITSACARLHIHIRTSWPPHSSALRPDPTSYDDLCSSSQLVLPAPLLPIGDFSSRCLPRYHEWGTLSSRHLPFTSILASYLIHAFPASDAVLLCCRVCALSRLITIHSGLVHARLVRCPPSCSARARRLAPSLSPPLDADLAHATSPLLRPDVPLPTVLHLTSEVHSARVRCSDGPDGVGHLTMQHADTKQSARARGSREKRHRAQARYKRYWLRRCWCTSSSALDRYRNEALHAHCGRNYGGQREKEESATCGSVASHTGYCCMRAPIAQGKGTRKANIRRNSIATFEMSSTPGIFNRSVGHHHSVGQPDDSAQ
ncbi:hypothetical protein K438DRAFT_1782749 [Mycena galopus ATCC 62051]|nr:hypothetical protein K438DRAFT_1782749 [Mycena galopus ATCC 62051]